MGIEGFPTSFEHTTGNTTLRAPQDQFSNQLELPEAISFVHQQHSVVQGLNEDYQKALRIASETEANLEEISYAKAMQAYMETRSYPVTREQVTAKIREEVRSQQERSSLSEEQLRGIADQAWLKLCKRLQTIAQVE